MKTIWKWDLVIDSGKDEKSLLMPKGAEILSCQVQHGLPRIWALVDPNGAAIERRIVVHGTGHPVHEKKLRFIDTIQYEDGVLIFHVFEVLD